MFYKTKLALVAALFAAAFATHAELLPYKKVVEFEALQPVSGKSGRKVTLSAVLYRAYINTETRKREFHPLPGAKIVFRAHRGVNKTGTKLTDPGVVGREAVTDANGVATTTYKLPAGVKKKASGNYLATFQGGEFDGVLLPAENSKKGTVIVSP